MSERLNLHRYCAGYYETQLSDGRVVTIEYLDKSQTAGYDDEGWVWWINKDACRGEERADFPVDTKRYAIELLRKRLEIDLSV